ncbi:hypothetical protein [Nesterenkonia pannonica]|uniref:hypothetical protein n=1 Tax=Nesterenkonia pannonica TaxID=1548602 RepID=UPI0021645A1F|nr:hypothetical protein [Nesterenkonia pannonica]
MSNVLRAAMRPILNLALSLTVITVVWVALLEIFDVSGIIGKGPWTSMSISSPRRALPRTVMWSSATSG